MSDIKPGDWFIVRNVAQPRFAKLVTLDKHVAHVLWCAPPNYGMLFSFEVPLAYLVEPISPAVAKIVYGVDLP